MSSIGGMDMGSEGPVRSTNARVAQGFWYGIAGIVGLLTLLRGIESVQCRQRQKLQEANAICVPSKPQGQISQAYATATSTLRELSYRQPVYFTGRISKYCSPLPVGRKLILMFY